MKKDDMSEAKKKSNQLVILSQQTVDYVNLN